MQDIVKLSDIRPDPIALRQVDREREEYLELVQSVREKGVIEPIQVREKTDNDTGETYYELLNGLHRYTASKDAGRETIPMIVVEADDAEALEIQLITNAVRIDTRPAEFTAHLKRLMNMNPTYTIGDLAQKLGKSVAWISNRMSLSKIKNETLNELIDDGQIPLSNAYALSKLPEDEQPDWAERAQTESSDTFVAAVNDRAKEIAAERRKGRDAAPPTFTPTARMRKLGEFKAEIESGEVSNTLIEMVGASTAQEGFKLAVEWALHLDAPTVEADRAKWEADQAAREEAKKERARKRAEEKAAKAKAAAEKAAAEAEASV